MARENKKIIRLDEESLNYQNYIMKIIEYNNANDIIVEFQDKYKGKVHTTYGSYKNKKVKNPYHPDVCGVGIIGNKYSARLSHGEPTKEYYTWRDMLRRCFDTTKNHQHIKMLHVHMSFCFLKIFMNGFIHNQILIIG